MLIVPPDPQWKVGPPGSVGEFRNLVAGRLGDAWDVALAAYDNDAPDDVADISAQINASDGALLVSITRHAGFDTVLVGLSGVPPAKVPLEDIAAASGWVAEESVLALADQESDDLQPFLPLNDALGFLDESRSVLAGQLQDADYLARLREIAARFAHRLLTPDAPP